MLSPVENTSHAVSLLLLAGGRGERLGGQDKGLLLLYGQTFAERLLQRFASETNEVLISANRNIAIYEQLAARWGGRVLMDSQPDFSGPLAGILSGLTQANSDWVLVLPCDAQSLPNHLLERLRRTQELTQAHAVFASFAEQDQPLVCLLRRSLVHSLEDFFATGQRAVIRWLMHIDAARCVFDEDGITYCWSINTAEDLATVISQNEGLLQESSSLKNSIQDCNHHQNLMPLESALSHYKTLPTLMASRVLLQDASGCVLAESAHAACDLPAFTQSAMDGYALCHVDANKPLRLIGEVAAGDMFARSLQAGEAVRIFTGGRLPEGADTVARQEIVQVNEQQLSISEPLSKGQDVRLRGEEAQCSQQILAAGQRLTPGRVAALAMANVSEVVAYQKPRVAVIITGKEVTRLGEPLADGAISDANGPLILSWLQTQGLPCVDIQWVGDDLDELAAAMTQLSAKADWLITTGGASVGDYDYLAPAAERAGFACDFHGVAQRPGKPVWFGRKPGCVLLALPGNPGAVWVGLYVHAAAILAQLEGTTAPVWQRGRIAKSMKMNPSVALLQRMRQYQDDEGCVWLEALPHQGSHQLSNLAQADALVWLPVGAGGLERGTVLSFLSITL